MCYKIVAEFFGIDSDPIRVAKEIRSLLDPSEWQIGEPLMLKFVDHALSPDFFAVRFFAAGLAVFKASADWRKSCR